MAESRKEKLPPVNLEDLEEDTKEEQRGPISYAGNSNGEYSERKRPKGPRLKASGGKGGAIGILQVFIPILASVVIAFLLINAMAVNKGTYSTGVNNLQSSVSGQIAGLDSKVTNVINNYASKSELTGFLKASDLSGYATQGALAAIQSQVTTLQGQVSSLNPTTQAQVQALITQALGNTTAYVTQTQFDSKMDSLLTNLGALITAQSTTLPTIAYGGSSGTISNYYYMVGPAPIPGGSYTYSGIKLVISYPTGVIGTGDLQAYLVQNPSMLNPALVYSSAETVTLNWASGYLSSITVTYNGPGSTGTTGSVWFIPLFFADGLGSPSSVTATPVVKLTL